MKKNSRKQTAMVFAALAEREADSLVIGIDVGDWQSQWCVRTRLGEVVLEGSVETKPQKMLEWLQGLKRQRMVLETGAHSQWMAGLLKVLGHEVIVGNARKLTVITQNDQKSDKVDARLLSKLGMGGMEWLASVYQRRQETQNDLRVVRARDLLVGQRAALINSVRGMVKSFGRRIRQCEGDAFGKVAEKEIPAELAGGVKGLLKVLEAVDQEIEEYERKIQQLCGGKYKEQTKWLLGVYGVGPITALTYVLTIEEAERFADSRDVGAYVGLVAKRRQSGRQDPQLGISKAGDEMLRKLLVNCAHTILRRQGEDSDLRRWGLRLLEAGQRGGKKGARKRAVTAVARKLAVLLHVLWKKQRKYERLRVAEGKAKAVMPAA